MPMLYRSPLTRWFLSAVGVISGLIFTFGDAHKWRSTPSLHWLAQAPIPLQLWGVAFIVYALMLLCETTRPAGYAVGAVLFAIFTVSLFATLPGKAPKNVIALAAMLQTVVFHALSVRTAWAAKLST